MNPPHRPTGAPPRVSIVIPCHNLADHVAQTLAAASAQDHPSYEVIVVDDGSSDGTPAALAPFAKRGVSILRQPNRGAAAARNAGFAASRGRFILFLDGDDLIPSHHLSALDQALGGSQSEIAFGQWDRFTHDPAEARFPARPGYRDSAPIDWLIEDWASARPMTQCGTFLLPRDLIEHHGGWDESLSLIDDFEFFARMIVASDGLRFAPQARVHYRSVQGSLSSRRTHAAAQSALESLLKGTAHLLAAEDSPRTRRTAAALLLDFDYGFYPDHPDLRQRARRRCAELGGTDLQPDGPPGFQRLRRLVGWRFARRIQFLVERLRAFLHRGPGRAGMT